MSSEQASGNAKKRKLNVEIRTIEVGHTFTGIYKGKTTRDWIDPDDGEVKPLTTVVFQELASEDRFGVFQDMGLKTALENALVVEGMKIEIKKLPKIKLANSNREVNQYDIYGL